MSKALEALEEIYNWIYCNCGTTYEDDVKLDEIRKNIQQAIEELDKFKALLNKYEIKDIKALEELIKDYDDMAKALIQYTLGIEVEVKS